MTRPCVSGSAALGNAKSQPLSAISSKAIATSQIILCVLALPRRPLDEQGDRRAAIVHSLGWRIAVLENESKDMKVSKVELSDSNPRVDQAVDRHGDGTTLTRV